MGEDADEIVLSHGDISLYEADLRTLNEGGWLNDRILSFAVTYLYETMLNDDEKESVFIFDAPLCQMLKFMDLNYIMSLCETLLWNEKEHLIFILNDHADPSSPGGSHWSVLFYQMGSEYFSLVDSLPNPQLDTAKQVLKIMTRCLGLSCAELVVENSAKQPNGSDCGLYAIEFVRLYLEGISDKNRAMSYDSLEASEVELQRDGWLTIIRNLINEKKNAACMPC